MKQLTATIITALFCAACGTTQLKNSLALELSDVDAIHIMPGTPHPIRADNAKIISTAELLDMVRQVDYIKLDSSEPIGVIDKMIFSLYFDRTDLSESGKRPICRISGA